MVEGEQHLIVRVKGVEERIKRFVSFAKLSYAPEASVEAIEVKDYEGEVMSIDSFRQSFMVSLLAKIIDTWEGMLKKWDDWIAEKNYLKGR